MTTRLGSKIFRDLYHLRIVNEDISSLSSIISPMSDDRNSLYNPILGIPQLCLKNDILQRLKKPKVMNTPNILNSEITKNISKIPAKKEFDEKLCSKKIDNIINKELAKDTIKKLQKQQVASKTNYVNKRYESTSLLGKPITRTDSCVTNYKQMRPLKIASNTHISKINGFSNERYAKETLYAPTSMKPKKISLLQDTVNFNRSVNFVVPRVYGQWKDSTNLTEYQSKLFVKDATARIVNKKRPKTPRPPHVSRSLPVNFLAENIKTRARIKAREGHFKGFQMYKISPPSPSFSETLNFC